MGWTTGDQIYLELLEPSRLTIVAQEDPACAVRQVSVAVSECLRRIVNLETQVNNLETLLGKVIKTVVGSVEKLD